MFKLKSSKKAVEKEKVIKEIDDVFTQQRSGRDWIISQNGK